MLSYAHALVNCPPLTTAGSTITVNDNYYCPAGKCPGGTFDITTPSAVQAQATAGVSKALVAPSGAESLTVANKPTRANPGHLYMYCPSHSVPICMHHT